MRFMVGMVLALALVGCSEGGNDGARAGGESSASGADTPRVAYEDYWVQLVDALNPPDPERRALLARVAGRERQAAKQLIALRKSAGELVRGTYEHDLVMGDHDSTHAELTDCLTARTQVFTASTGERIRKDEPGPYPVAVSLELKNGTWKVVEISSSPHACPRPVDGTTASFGEIHDQKLEGSK